MTDSTLMMACPEITSTVTYSYESSTEMCTQSTVVTVGTDAEPAHEELVDTNICCAVGRDPPTSPTMDTITLKEACTIGPELTSIVTLAWDDSSKTCIESTVFKSDEFESDETKMENVNAAECCIAGLDMGDSGLTMACELVTT